MSRYRSTIYSLDQRLAKKHTLTTRAKTMANWTETTRWPNDHKPNSSRFIVIHSPWDSAISSSSMRLNGAGYHIPVMHRPTNSCRFRLPGHFFDLCRTSSLHPGHKPNRLEPMDTIAPLRYIEPGGYAEMRWNIATCRLTINTRPSAILSLFEITSFPGAYTSPKKTWERRWRLKSQPWASDMCEDG